MRKLLLVASVLAIAGCSQSEEQAPAEPVETAAPAEPAAPLAADGLPVPGKYKVTMSDGKVVTEELKSDGTYVATDETGTVVETGTYNQTSAEEYCYTVDEQYREEGDTGEPHCNAEGIGEDGRWFSTSPDGKTAYVERVTE